MSNTPPQMTAQQLAAYKHLVENIVFIKRQQWRVTGYAVAILAWFYASAASDENQKTLIAFALVVGWFLCAYFLFRMQFDLASERRVINKVKEKFFCDDPETFGKTYESPLRRDFDYPFAFLLIILVACALVIFSLKA